MRNVRKLGDPPLPLDFNVDKRWKDTTTNESQWLRLSAARARLQFFSTSVAVSFQLGHVKTIVLLSESSSL